jgi:hypothetical protein
MAQNFIGCDREQELLLPPSLGEWLPEGHLDWFVIDAVAEMDLAAFYAGYRRDGHGRAAHDPAMMVALLLYAYATGRRSSRAGVRRRCRVPGDRREPAAGSLHDCALLAAPWGGSGRGTAEAQTRTEHARKGISSRRPVHASVWGPQPRAPHPNPRRRQPVRRPA